MNVKRRTTAGLTHFLAICREWNH